MTEKKTQSEKPSHTIKELASLYEGSGLDEAKVRSIIGIFEIPARGLAPKKTKSPKQANLYAREDFDVAIKLMANTKAAWPKWELAEPPAEKKEDAEPTPAA